MGSGANRGGVEGLAGRAGAVQDGDGGRCVSNRVGEGKGGLGGARGVQELGKSSMCWSGIAHSCRRAGTKIVCSLWMSSQRDRPARLATTTKSTGHLAGGRREGGLSSSGGAPTGENRIWRGAREVRISMFSWDRMSLERQGVSSHLGRMRRQRKGVSYEADSRACRTAWRISAAIYSGLATQDPVQR